MLDNEVMETIMESAIDGHGLSLHPTDELAEVERPVEGGGRVLEAADEGLAPGHAAVGNPACELFPDMLVVFGMVVLPSICLTCPRVTG